MKNNVETEQQQIELFGGIFLLANKLQTIGDSYLKEVTTKQWFLMMIVEQFGDYHPTLSEVAKEVGSSRQNLKQIALKLQDKGLLIIEKDTKDSRILRLSLSEKSREFWGKRAEQDKDFIMGLFHELSPDEIGAMWSGFHKLYANICKLGEKYSE
ncbi:MarR family winged helix-turn-helix transcriptional regulator [Paenibacillus segetis]|uniref:MarR family transcriptional regulator n=1 Tax=Paenibacillus segetis TaxID=1325360 RepID=A0ABQ1YUI2_9BACL|nr:MarR family transcriptional regulator [Paenibacillus segetis]GGH37008.1 MarR family transcriptional regulator [Paenibacillus segetis]